MRVALLLAGLLVSLSVAEAAAPDASQLGDACFSRSYGKEHLIEHPGQRVSAVSVHFQEFGGSLLAGISYRLIYGGTYGVSGECEKAAGGGFSCKACTNGSCDSAGESFNVQWSGGDILRIVNDRTGMLGGNPMGGRYYILPRGDNSVFQLRRTTAEKCG